MMLLKVVIVLQHPVEVRRRTFKSRGQVGRADSSKATSNTRGFVLSWIKTFGGDQDEGLIATESRAFMTKGDSRGGKEW